MKALSDLTEADAAAPVVRGSELAEVTAIGAQSEIGKIGQSLATLETEPPRLRMQTRRVVSRHASAGSAGADILLALTLGAGFIALVVLEMLKPLLRPRLHSRSRPNEPLAMDQTAQPTGR